MCLKHVLSIAITFETSPFEYTLKPLPRGQIDSAMVRAVRKSLNTLYTTLASDETRNRARIMN